MFKRRLFWFLGFAHSWWIPTSSFVWISVERQMLFHFFFVVEGARGTRLRLITDVYWTQAIDLLLKPPLAATATANKTAVTLRCNLAASYLKQGTPNLSTTDTEPLTLPTTLIQVLGWWWPRLCLTMKRLECIWGVSQMFWKKVKHLWSAGCWYLFSGFICSKCRRWRTDEGQIRHLLCALVPIFMCGTVFADILWAAAYDNLQSLHIFWKFYAGSNGVECPVRLKYFLLHS